MQKPLKKWPGYLCMFVILFGWLADEVRMNQIDDPCVRMATVLDRLRMIDGMHMFDDLNSRPEAQQAFTMLRDGECPGYSITSFERGFVIVPTRTAMLLGFAAGMLVLVIGYAPALRKGARSREVVRVPV